jgi:hypothetical protein
MPDYTLTANYGLKKDTQDAFYDVDKVNENLDKTDLQMKNNADTAANAGDIAAAAAALAAQHASRHHAGGVDELTPEDIGAATAADVNALKAVNALLSTGGTAPNFTISPTPAITAYANGQTWTVRFHSDAISPTLNVSGKGAGNIYASDGKAARVKAGQIVRVVRYGTGFFIVSGGGGDFNIYTQTGTPSAADGLWIKSDDVTAIEMSELNVPDGTRITMGATLESSTAYTSAVPINGIAYVLGGENINTIRAYDPSTDIRTTKSATLASTTLAYACAVAIDGIAYTFGSNNGNIIQAYDPENDIRTTLSATMAQSIFHLAAASPINGIAYVFGGSDNYGSPYSTIQAFDPSTGIRTTKGAALSVAVRWNCSSAVGTIGYVFGGRNSSSTYYNVIQAYDAVTDIRTTKSATLYVNMAAMRSAAVYTIIYIIGGENSSGSLLNAIQAYDTVTDIRTTKSVTLSANMSGASAVEIYGTVYIFGGRIGSSTYTNMIQAYRALTTDHPIGTAVIVLDSGAQYQATLFDDGFCKLRPRIKSVLFQSENGLSLVSSAVRTDGGSWQDIAV